MFLIGHQYKKVKKNIFRQINEKDFLTTHFKVRKDEILPLFKLYFNENKTEKIIIRLRELDKEFKAVTKS